MHCYTIKVSWALLTQEEEKGRERALYYPNKTLARAELNYSSIEKMCLALFFTIDKLRYYMQVFMVHLVVKANPIKYNVGSIIKFGTN